MRRNFKFNFTVSFICYAIVSIISFFLVYLHAIVYRETVGVIALIWFFSFPIIAYFIVGMTLKPLKNPLWNYFSVSSSLIFSVITTSLGLAIENRDYWGYVVNMYFGRGTFLIIEALDVSGYYLLAIIPTIIMWLGLTFKVQYLGSGYDTTNN